MQPDSYEGLYEILSAIVRGNDIRALLAHADTERFPQRAARNRVAAVISRALAAHPANELPFLRRPLRAHELGNILKVDRLREQLDGVVVMLNAAGLVPVLLKGASRIWQQSDEYELHDSVDIDLLLPAEQIAPAAQVLRENAYTQTASPARLRYYDRHHHHAAPLFPPSGVSVELHHHLFLADRLSIGTDYPALAPRMRESVQGEKRALVLDAVGTALHLTVHAFGRAPLRDVYLLARLLRDMNASERAELAALLSAETKEPVRLAAIVYDAACMAGVPWPASSDVRAFAEWCRERHALPPKVYARAFCVDAALAQPQHAFSAFLKASCNSRPVAEALGESVIRHPARALLNLATGARILYARKRAARRNGALQSALRHLVRSNVVVYRAATAVRACVRQWMLPPLSSETGMLIARYPELGRFVSQARRKKGRAAAFAELLRTPFLTRYLNSELERLAHGEASLGRITDYTRTLPIVQTPEFVLRIQFVDSKAPREILSVARDSLLSPLGAGVRVRRYAVPNAALRGCFEPAASLTDRGTTRVAPGEITALRAGVDACQIVPEESHCANLIVEDVRAEELSWRFDATTLACTGAVSNDASVARLRETLDLAAALDIRDVVPAARSLLDHPSHFVRWSTLSAVSRLSEADALPLLRRAARDRHPQLRRAARRMLAEKAQSWH